MSPDQFDKIVHEAMASRSAWFSTMEPAISADLVTRVEFRLGRSLPEEFVHFATTVGSGYFGCINVSSLDEESDWYVLSRPAVHAGEGPMLVVSDDEAGGYYGFPLGHEGYEDHIIYVHPDDGDHLEEIAPSFFDYIKGQALAS